MNDFQGFNRKIKRRLKPRTKDIIRALRRNFRNEFARAEETLDNLKIAENLLKEIHSEISRNVCPDFKLQTKIEEFLSRSSR